MTFEQSDEMPRGMNDMYNWFNQFHFSRAVKNTARDFSDAVLLAEILAQLVPAWVQLHNYPSAHRFQQKLSNWETLNREVLTRLKCGISRRHQEDLANSVPGAIELLLIQVKKTTANSPFLQAKRVYSPQISTTSTRQRSLSTSFECSPPSTPFPAKKTTSPGPLQSSNFNSLLSTDDQHDPAATFFSKLLQMMSDTTEDSEGVMKISQPKTRSRTNTAPTIQLTSQTRGVATRPLTPNYAKPTRSTIAMARSATVNTKSQLPQASPYVLARKNDPVSKASLPDKPKLLVELEKKHLPSDTNEFHEGAFVYFLSLEALPALSFEDPEDHAPVARVIRTRPSGECALQLYRRIPSRDSPQNSPKSKTRCYFATPHFIDCCSSLLHAIPNIIYDSQTNTCEWHARARNMENNKTNDTPPQQTQSIVQPPQRHFYTEVLARATFTSATLTQPIRQTSVNVYSGLCFPCPSFAELFSIPHKPTVFPKVRVSLTFELPERYENSCREKCTSTNN
ncbi:hypothetical protein L916_07868 [Phytophthora nicotianae]|uniref:Calponin-homology (CH) domain-containing protein n=1 Tax=Phytophthora nicotianae TaxID=4792 RepID=W2J650_PHYNI|nr:hypothetical protein L916_07868 [Phytophthora nicotianae]